MEPKNNLIYRVSGITELSNGESESMRIPSEKVVEVASASEMIETAQVFLSDHIEKARGILEVVEGYYVLDFNLKINLIGFGTLNPADSSIELTEAEVG